MRFHQIQKIAKEYGINTYRMKKDGMIRSIQGVENNPQCYGTERVAVCGEQGCLWRSDCLGPSQRSPA